MSISSNYPALPARLTPMEGDPSVFGSRQIFRLQAPHVAAQIGSDALEITTVPRERQPDVGTVTIPAVDVGAGADMTAARDGLGVVRWPAIPDERAAITQRALDAGVAVVAFVDEQRPRLAEPGVYPTWADVPVVLAGGGSASRLIAAGQGGEAVTVTGRASPYVYDIVRSDAGQVVPDTVITREARSRLATIDESFHRDIDGTGAVADTRGPLSGTFGAYLQSVGPLPEHRTAYVTPDVTWQSGVLAPAVDEIFGSPFTIEEAPVVFNTGERYRPDGRRSLRWLARPQWPGPAGGPRADSYCQPDPVTRTADTLSVWMAGFQDGRDRYGCIDPVDATMSLERDGLPIGTADGVRADFAIPPERGTYRLTLDAQGEAPYVQRSNTTWTFRSAVPDGEALVPLLVVDYRLPLDTSNRLTGSTANLVIRRLNQDVTAHQTRPVALDRPDRDVVPPQPEARPSFDELYLEAKDRMTRLAWLLVGSQPEAEELVHDAFLAVYRRWDGIDNPGGYLRRTVVNRCLQRRRRQHREHDMLAAMRQPPPTGDAIVDPMWDGIQRLRPERRAVIVLRYWADLPHGEIARLLDCPVSTVRTRLHRALADLREEIDR